MQWLYVALTNKKPAEAGFFIRSSVSSAYLILASL